MNASPFLQLLLGSQRRCGQGRHREQHTLGSILWLVGFSLVPDGLLETTSFLFLLSSAPMAQKNQGSFPQITPLPPRGSQRELTNERAGLDLKDPGEEGPFASQAVAARPGRFTAASQRVPENHRFPAIIRGLGWELPRHSCTSEFMRTRLDASG